MKIITFLLLLTSILFSQTINIDLNVKKSLNGVMIFHRNRFINMHSTPTSSDINDQEISYLVDTLGIGFGRSIGKVDWQLSLLKEDPNRPGYPDLSLMQQQGNKNVQDINKSSRWQKYGTNEIILAAHPQNVIPNPVKQNDPNAKGYVPKHNEGIAEFYANYVKLYYPDKFRPLFIEFANEPMVHANEMKVTYQDISTFFKVCAKKTKQMNPNVYVGGFASAWPSFELWDFKHWNDRMKTFIDIAGSELDYISVHLYDGVNVSGTPVRRSGSNAEAILDIIEAYTYIKLGKALPFVISEYGMTQKGWTDEGYSDEKAALAVNSINHLLFQQLDREDRILKSIPFIVSKAKWFSNSKGTPYPWVLWRQVNGKWVYTEYIKFYKLWKNVKGTRALIYSDDPDIQTQLFIDNTNKTAYLCINNLELNDKTVQLNYLSNINNINSIKLRRLYKNGTKLVFSETSLDKSTKSLTLNPQETDILIIKLNNSINFTNTLVEKNYYTNKYLQDISANKTISFTFNNIETATDGFAKLKIGIGRNHGLSLQPIVKVNGTKVNVPNDWKGDEQKDRDQFFGVIEVPFDISLLKATTTVDITFPDNGGKVSSVILNVQKYEKALVNLLPSVKIKRPANNEVFKEGDNVVVEVEASDQDGNIKQVNLFINGKFIRPEKVYPYLWNDKGQDSVLNNMAAGTYVIKVVAIDDRNGMSSDSVIIQVNKTTKVKNTMFIDKDNIVFPNPISLKAFLKVEPEVIKSIKVYNINGEKEAVKVENSGNKVSIDMSLLKDGIYIIEVAKRNGEVIRNKVYKIK